MEIRIANCNNISTGIVSLTEGLLNLKYAINGTGKSTIAKAIESAAKNDAAELKELTPYPFIGDNEEGHQPSVIGVPEDVNIAVFNENYVNQYVFLDDELLKNSFEVFVKTENYEQKLAEINRLIANVRAIFEDNPDLESLLQDLNEFISAFGNNTRTGIANNGALAKGLSNGNLIQNIPVGLEEYSVFLRNEQNSKWLKWQATGRDFMSLGDNCPFCAGELAPRREKIERIKDEYDAKTIEHLSKILGLIERLGHYFSEETNQSVRRITQSVQGLSEEQKHYLVEIKGQVDLLYKKLIQLKHLGFDSLKDIDRLADAMPGFKIDMSYFTHLNSEYTNEKVGIINASIDHLIGKVGRLQGAVNQQKQEIRITVQKYNREINDFLKNAGYSYTVSIDETPDHSYKLMLKFGEGDNNTVSAVKKHLSYGERNAFALVLFMYQAIYMHANLIVLDDPISSFDKNKKFAILDMLFIRGGSLRGKTTLLLTHDFEPVIDAVYNHPSFFQGVPSATFVENNHGVLAEKSITVNDIKSFVQLANENIGGAEHPVIKSIYLRRLTEVVSGKTMAWHLLSNLLHKRETPTIGQDEMSQEQIEDAMATIQEYIPEFDYERILQSVLNRAEMIDLYQHSESNYEKLQIYRLLYDATDENHVMRKFINETYHVENDYLFQLNPVTFNTIPNYIIAECNRTITNEREQIEALEI